MDPLGNVVRELLKQAHAQRVRNAVALAREYSREGMTKAQVREMLCASEFEQDVIRDALDEVSFKRG